jgi:phosphopantetheinyl transferase (holo-ACP synthase)
VRIIPTPWPDRAIVVADLITHEEWFTSDELAIANEFKLAKRRDEWLLSRAAAKRWALQRGLCDDARACNVARPFLVIDGVESEWHVSLSHSSPYAGAVFARDPVGIDVQVLRDFPDAAAHLFLTNDEEEQMRTCAVPHRLLHFWCAKEAAWKKLGGAVPTLKQVPIHIESANDSGIVFDVVESVLINDVIVAITA